MLINMRTTLVLDDRLFKAAKRIAAERKTTLSEVVNDALRRLTTPVSKPRKKVNLPTYGDPRNKRNISPKEIAEALLEHV